MINPTDRLPRYKKISSDNSNQTHSVVNLFADSQSQSKIDTNSNMNDNELSLKSNSTVNDFNNKIANKSAGSNRLKRRKKVFIGDLSCMKNGFKPAPKIMNADIKYIR